MHQDSANSIDPIHEFEGLTLGFCGIRVLDRVSFKIASCSITSAIRPNSAGKSSLLNTISEFYRPSAGRVHFFGKNITHHCPPARVRFGLARSAQSTSLFRGMMVLDNIKLGRHCHLLTKELDHDVGEVTAAMKKCRFSIYKTYSDEIETMYAGGSAND